MLKSVWTAGPPFGILSNAGRNGGRSCWRATGQGISRRGSSRRWEKRGEDISFPPLSPNHIGLIDPIMPQKTRPEFSINRIFATCRSAIWQYLQGAPRLGNIRVPGRCPGLTCCGPSGQNVETPGTGILPVSGFRTQSHGEDARATSCALLGCGQNSR